MPTTPTYLLPYPAQTDPADVPLDMQRLAERVEAVVGPGTVNGQVPVWDQANKKWAAALPSGAELAYATFSGNKALPTTIVAAPSITLDGVTPIIVECYAPLFEATVVAVLQLFDNGADQGNLAQLKPSAASNIDVPVLVRRKLTPAAGAHVFDWRGFLGGGTGQVVGGAGGAGNFMPGYIRVTKA